MRESRNVGERLTTGFRTERETGLRLRVLGVGADLMKIFEHSLALNYCYSLILIKTILPAFLLADLVLVDFASFFIVEFVALMYPGVLPILRD